MKFWLFSSEIFWGSLLILFGCSIIIKAVFNIDIPFIKIFFALFLIYLGFSMISDIGTSKKNRRTIAFKEQTIKPEKIDNYYKVMFGKAVIDLRHLYEQQEKAQTIKINTFFGETVLKINKNIPTKIIANVTFGTAQFPDNASISSGNYSYKNYSHETEPLIVINADVVFGSLSVVQE
ncbi:MAG: LiaF domain-containing protein [Candidatus Babeliales bacterium]